MEPTKDDFVGFYTSPCVPGARVGGFFGPVHVNIFVPGRDEDNWLDATSKMFDDMEVAIRKLGGNAALGVDITMDPFAIEDGKDGLRVYASATAASLEAWD